VPQLLSRDPLPKRARERDDGDMASSLVSLEETSYFPAAHNWRLMSIRMSQVFQNAPQKPLLAILRGDDRVACAEAVWNSMSLFISLSSTAKIFGI